MCRKIFFLTAAFYLSFNTAAFEPVYHAGVSGSVNRYSDSSDDSIFTGLSGDVFQRETFNEGYYSWYAGTVIDLNLSDDNEYKDMEKLSVDLHLERGLFEYEGRSSIKFSLNSIDYGAYFQPDWGGSVFFIPDSPYSLKFDYNGSIIYQEDYYEDRVINSFGISAGYDPSFKFSSSVALKGIVENYSEYYLFNSFGNETSSKRFDRKLSAEISAGGTAGYFAEWEITAETGFQDSNANRFSSAYGLDEDSEDLISYTLSSLWSFSPLSSVEIGAEGFAGYLYYTDRKALDDDGGMGDSNLTVFKTGGTLDLGWTKNNLLFWSIYTSFYRSFSADPEFDEWGLETGAGIEYSF